MTSRASVRITKKDRPRSSNQTSIGKKGGRGGRDGTPDKPSSPNALLEDENESQRKVIISEEILALRVKPEDLERIREPQPPAEGKRTPTTTSVIIRKLKPPVEFNQPRAHSVVIAKPAPPDAPVMPPSYDGMMCARFDNNGNIIPHSILGDVDEFKEEALRRGDLPVVAFETSRSSLHNNERLTVKFEKKTKKRSYPRFESADESNALKNWEEKMLERKRQQGYLSRLLNKPISQLVMNQGDGFRKTQELRYLIDRTIPFIDNGKGYRVGSEFWKQQNQIGGELDGMHLTLSLTEKGYPPPIEHVGVPQCALNDKGLESELPSTVIHKPWHRAAYLRERVIQLAPLMDELDPHEPEMMNLEIVGNAKEKAEEQCMNAMNAQMCSDQQKLQKRIESEGRYESALDTNEGDPFQEIPDVYPAPVFGPSIQFAGQPARWTGDSHNFRGQVGIEARVSFESCAGQRTTSFLEIVNDGTTCIYYNWKKVTKPNTFEVINANTQRFYFNPGNGVILPGDTMKFPFVFKSSNSGIFSEQWEFHTHPVVCGGATLLVTLRAVALKQDKFEKQREDVERELRHKEAEQIVSDVLDGLLKGIQAPERPRSPVDAYVTEGELFQRKNPQLHFTKEKCDQLRDLYVEAFPEEDRHLALWDLSLGSVRQVILQIPEDDNRKQDLLQKLNQIVSSMSFKPMLPTPTAANRVGYTILCLGVDKLVQSAVRVSQMTGYQESRPGSSVPSSGPASNPQVSVPAAPIVQLKVESSPDSRRSRGKEKKGGKEKATPSKGKDKEHGSSVKSPQGSRRVVPSPPAPHLLPDSADTPSPSAGKALEIKTKYQEKLYTQAHETICNVIDEMELALAKVLNRQDYDLLTCKPPLSPLAFTGHGD